MSNAIILFLQIIKMFLMMSVGYYLCKKNVINEKVNAGLSTILLYVAIPATLLNSFAVSYDSEKAYRLIVSFLLSIAIDMICMLFAEIFCHKKSAVFRYGVVFSNAGFIGIPLVTGVFGSEAVFYLAPFVAMFNVFTWSYGVFIMSKDKSQVSAKKVITNPCVFVVFICLLIYLLQIKLPLPLKESISGFAGLNTPLAMLILGSYLAQSSIKEMLKSIEAYKVCLYRLVIVPLVILLAMKLIPESFNDIKLILFIAEAAPVGATSSIFAKMFNEDVNFSVQTICLSTLLCLFTIPVLIMLAQLLW